MPEADLELMVTSASGHWGPAQLSGPARLRLTSDAVVIEPAAGAALSVPYADLQGGGWRTGTLALHGEDGSVTVEAARGLDQAWVTLLARACRLPELARGHRLLGSRRGGPAAAQARFLAPLLQARRLVEEQADLDVRVAAFDARVVRERIDAALQGIARDSWPSSDPDRRALEAELEEAVEGLGEALTAVEQAARHFRDAGEPVRFMAWRAWVAAVAAVFARADADWSNAARLIPETRGTT